MTQGKPGLCGKFQASLSYVARSCLSQNQQNLNVNMLVTCLMANLS